MSKKIDMLGLRFGNLVVIEEAKIGYWKCRCDCGNERITKGSRLRDGSVYSCIKCVNKRISERRHKSLVGQTFGRLFVKEEVGKTKTGEYIYKCVCSCNKHTELEVLAGNLTSGNTKSCGCLQKEKAAQFTSQLNKGNYKDLVGQKFGKLTVIEMSGINSDGIPLWKCRCDCDDKNEIIVRRDYLVGGIVKSCGCLRHLQSRQFKDLTGQHFGKLTAKKYMRKNNRTYWECECNCDNHSIITVESNHLLSGHTLSCGCTDIAHRGSYSENEIRDIIKDMLGDKEVIKTRILDGKEIDIYIPSLNLGIEYNGSYYHATLGVPYTKPSMYHRDKFLLAKEKGVHLISIFDVDWVNNQEKIKMYLSSLLLSQQRLMARKCEIKKVDNNVACQFVDKYHIQGSNKAMMKINYGLYYNNELYAVMSFGKLRLSKTDDGQYELHRYAVKDGYTVVGGADKLLKAFEREYIPKYILSYSDNDYFIGGIYERLGFENKGQCKPRYFWYLNGEELKRERCMLKNLKRDYPELLQEAYDISASNKEDYVMLQLGAYKVYRSGNTKWEKSYDI